MYTVPWVINKIKEINQQQQWDQGYSLALKMRLKSSNIQVLKMFVCVSEKSSHVFVRDVQAHS